MLTVMLAGVALWSGAHLWKRLAPEGRAVWGEKGKALVTALLLVGVVLMVLGYRAAPVVPLWEPPPFLRHVNNLLMLLAVYLFAASGLRTRITAAIRHPQLTGFKTWAVAHLLVNGDLASILLFGALLGWAVAEVVLINRTVPRPPPPPPASAAREAGAVVAALVVFAGLGAVHAWLGYPPFG